MPCHALVFYDVKKKSMNEFNVLREFLNILAMCMNYSSKIILTKIPANLAKG